MNRQQICMYARMYTDMYVCIESVRVYVCMHVCTLTCTICTENMCMYVCKHVCMLARSYGKCAYICLYMYVCIHVHLHICMYVHIHTCISFVDIEQFTYQCS